MEKTDLRICNIRCHQSFIKRSFYRFESYGEFCIIPMRSYLLLIMERTKLYDEIK